MGEAGRGGRDFRRGRGGSGFASSPCKAAQKKIARARSERKFAEYSRKFAKNREISRHFAIFRELSGSAGQAGRRGFGRGWAAAGGGSAGRAGKRSSSRTIGVVQTPERSSIQAGSRGPGPGPGPGSRVSQTRPGPGLTDSDTWVPGCGAGEPRARPRASFLRLDPGPVSGSG
jgi:hypothetical protein